MGSEELPPQAASFCRMACRAVPAAVEQRFSWRGASQGNAPDWIQGVLTMATAGKGGSRLLLDGIPTQAAFFCRMACRVVPPLLSKGALSSAARQPNYSWMDFSVSPGGN